MYSASLEIVFSKRKGLKKEVLERVCHVGKVGDIISLTKEVLHNATSDSHGFISDCNTEQGKSGCRFHHSSESFLSCFV